MKKCIEKCINEIIISCQAYEDTPLYGPENMKIMAQCAIMGGAKVVRSCWAQDIRAIRSLSDDLVIVGISKIMPKDNSHDAIFITPTFESAMEVIEAGADIVALDCRITKNRDAKVLKKLLNQIHEADPNIGIMADCETLEECLFCANSGIVDIVSTTLSGMHKDIEGPDIELIQAVKSKSSVLVNAEGRIWEKKDIDDVVHAGADMLTIGTAITRPHLITERFIQHYQKLKQE